MELQFSNSLQLKQSLKLNQVMIQRFNILQQSVQEFETSLQEEAKKNPFIYVRSQQSSAPFSAQGDDYVSPLEFATYEESLLSSLTIQLDAQMLPEQDYEITLMLIDHLDRTRP